MKYLTIEEVLDYLIGCTALSTGGGVAPSLEEVREMALKVLNERR